MQLKRTISGLLRAFLPALAAGIVLCGVPVTAQQAGDGAPRPDPKPGVDYWQPDWMVRELWGPGRMPKGMITRLLRHTTYMNYGVPPEYEGARSVLEPSRVSMEEGGRILRVLVGRYLEGRYTQGNPPTLDEMFRVYAPSADGNHPANYACFVAGKIGARPDQRLTDLVTV